MTIFHLYIILFSYNSFYSTIRCPKMGRYNKYKKIGKKKRRTKREIGKKAHTHTQKKKRERKKKETRFTEIGKTHNILNMMSFFFLYCK